MSGWTVVILVLVLVPVVLLSVPLTFKAGGRIGPDDRRMEAGFAWGGGLLAAAVGINGSKTSFRLKFARITLPLPRGKPSAARAEKKSKNPPRKGVRQKPGLSLATKILNRELLNEVLGYIKRLFKSLRLRLQLSGVYGAGDPALTGMLVGLMAALHTEDRFNLDLAPDFSGPVLDVAGETSGRIVPIAILWHTLRLVLAKPARKLWWALLKSKFIKRKQKEV